MADEQHLVRGVSWNEVFGFSHIFKSFKMAIHPSKIFLALVAIGLTFVLGVVMDGIWSGVSDSHRVMTNEAWEYWKAPSRAAFEQDKTKWLEVDRVTSLTSMLGEYEDITTQPARMAKKDFGKAVAKLEQKYQETYEQAIEKSEKDRIDKQEDIANTTDRELRREKEKKADARKLKDQQEALKTLVARKNRLRELEGEGIFAGFLNWQGHCLRNAIAAVRRGNFTTGLGHLRADRGSMVPGPYLKDPVPNAPAFDAAANDTEAYGLLAWLCMMGWGVWWMLSIYPVYSVIYILVALAVWSVFGGAICRMAALHAAREEKISLKAAVKFSVSKFLSFFTSPLLPLAVIVGIGLCLALGGLIGAIPYAGEWLFALLFGLALIAGAIIAFLTVGLVAGWPLMWPTIAVEGSDSFDAISRSFSYLFARPFRYLLYWLVAIVYGVICYLFVRLFAFLALSAIHCWAGWGMRAAGRDGYATGAGKLDVMWPKPTFESFHAAMQTEAMSNSEVAASYVLSFWVYLVAGIVLAFLACFLFSASTNIYYLLRRKVDATDLDDVYVEEEEEEEFSAEAPAAPEAPAEEKAAEEKPAEEKPPEEKPSEGEGGEEKSE